MSQIGLGGHDRDESLAVAKAARQDRTIARPSLLSRRIAAMFSRRKTRRAQLALLSLVSVVAVLFVAMLLHLQALALTQGAWSLGSSSASSLRGGG